MKAGGQNLYVADANCEIASVVQKLQGRTCSYAARPNECTNSACGRLINPQDPQDLTLRDRSRDLFLSGMFHLRADVPSAPHRIAASVAGKCSGQTRIVCQITFSHDMFTSHILNLHRIGFLHFRHVLAAVITLYSHFALRLLASQTSQWRQQSIKQYCFRYNSAQHYTRSHSCRRRSPVVIHSSPEGPPDLPAWPLAQKEFSFAQAQHRSQIAFGPCSS